MKNLFWIALALLGIYVLSKRNTTAPASPGGSTGTQSNARSWWEGWDFQSEQGIRNSTQRGIETLNTARDIGNQAVQFWRGIWGMGATTPSMNTATTPTSGGSGAGVPTGDNSTVFGGATSDDNNSVETGQPGYEFSPWEFNP